MSDSNRSGYLLAKQIRVPCPSPIFKLSSIIMFGIYSMINKCMNTCLICNKTFKSVLALTGHKRMHGKSFGKISPILVSCLLTNKVMPYQYLDRYQKSLKPCKQCNKMIKPNKNALYFCSRSCSASFNNANRGPRSEETKKKIKNSVSEYYKSNPKKNKNCISKNKKYNS